MRRRLPSSLVPRSCVQAAPRTVGGLRHAVFPARPRGVPRPFGSLCFPARLRGALEAPPSLVARSFVARSSVQAAPRPFGSLTLCSPLASGALLRHRLPSRSEEHTSELQSLRHLVCRLLLEKKTR